MQLIDVHGLTPDLYSFNSLIKACRIDNQWRCAFTQIREMQSFGIAPDIVSVSLFSYLLKGSFCLQVSFNSIIHAMSVAKEVWLYCMFFSSCKFPHFHIL
jgi:pentatricopeptide repeat protein